MIKKLLLVSLNIFIVNLTFINSQSVNTVKGYLLDESNNPLIGGTVQVLNTTLGCISDEYGFFELIVGDKIKSGRLIAKYIGYESKTLYFDNFVDTLKINLRSNTNEYTILPVDSTIIFSLDEKYSDYTIKSKHFYILNLYTAKYYGCSNYPIESSIDLKDNKIEVRILGVIEQDICLTELGPAKKSFEIELEEGKNYELSFKRRPGSPDSYKLKVTKEKISIEEEVNSFTMPEFKNFFMLPKNSFAFYCGTLLQNKFACEDCLSFLQEKIHLQEYFFDGEGRIPYFSDTSKMGHYYNAPVRYYIYSSEEDFKKIGMLIREFAILNNYNSMSGTSFHIVNWKKEEANSY